LGGEVTPGLSDQAWDKIRAAAKRTPDADTRAVLSRILFDEYPKIAKFVTDERGVTVDENSRRMLGHLDKFAELYRQTWLPHLDADGLKAILTGRAMPSVKIQDPYRLGKFIDDVKIERVLWMLQHLRLLTAEDQRTAHAIRLANEAHRSTEREFLYSRLCDVWIGHFHGELKFSRRRGGGRKPLIDFIREAFRQVVPDEVPTAETVADALRRERKARKDLPQRVAALLRCIGY
jgi:hypothetical protein